MEAVLPADVAAPPRAAAMPEIATSTIAGLPALELALEAGLRHEWDRLIDADPFASVYQTAGWCVPWYRCYADAYDPLVIVVRESAAVIGLIPMAVERAGGRLVFASDTMADYRDVVARPEHRAAVVDAMIGVYLAGRFRGPLRIGWIDPGSDTPALAAESARRRGLPRLVHHQPCWRWYPVEGENLQKKFSRVKTHLNYFKRQGDVRFDVIKDADDWAVFRDAFYRQHSLRQLQADREVSFDDPRKQRLYESLFEAREIPMHVTACRVGDRMVAGHIGLVWRDVLLLGAPSISLEDEHRSPAVILMAWIIQNAAALGLAGFDLTIGESEFKRRLGNRCVELSMVEIYRRRRDYVAESARAGLVQSAKQAAEAVLGEGAWKSRVKPAADAVRYKGARLRELGLRGAISKVAAFVPGRTVPDVVYAATRSTWSAASGTPAGFALHANQVDDLLLADDSAPSVRAALTACARTYARSRAAGHTLHTLVAGGRLAAWGYSRRTGESGGTVSIEEIAAPGGTAAASALIHGVIEAAFADGVQRAEVHVADDARSVRRALGSLGLRMAGGE